MSHMTEEVSMRRTARILFSVLLAGTSVVVAAPAQAGGAPAPISGGLASQLSTLTGNAAVFVHGVNIATSRQAVANAGLTLITTWDKIGVAVARGNAGQIASVRTQAGVTYVEGDQPITLHLST